MKKIIYIVVVIILAIGMQLGAGQIQVSDKNLLSCYADCMEEFEMDTVDDILIHVTLKGKYEEGYLREEDKERIVSYIASVCALEKEYITIHHIDGKSMIDIEFVNEGIAVELVDYVQMLERKCKETGFNVTKEMVIEGRFEGKMSEKEQEKYKKELFEKLYVDSEEGGRLLSRKMDNISYGYSPVLSDKISSAGKDINVCVAFVYNEKEDVTTMYLATPIINMEI